MSPDGYPSRAELRTIRTWKAESMGDYVGLMTYLRDRWRWTTYFVRGTRRYRRTKGGMLVRRWWISTGGWSGHEAMLDALQRNRMFMMLCFESESRGGHFIFEVPEPALAQLKRKLAAKIEIRKVEHQPVSDETVPQMKGARRGWKP